MSFFKVLATSANTQGRTGLLEFHGLKVDTPVFMPVGTYGMIRTLTAQDVEQCGYNLILNNAYHLYLRPGLKILSDTGGIAEYTRWKGGVLTDSGGFQIYSLSGFRKITDEGVYFRNHLDGSYHTFTPTGTVDIQRVIGSHIIMPLDECTASGIDKSDATKAMQRTHRWAKIQKEYNDQFEERQFLFGIVQGNMYEDLRQESARTLVDMDFDGYSIGGLSVGEEKPIMYHLTGICTELLPKNKPRYLMGVGAPEDIVEAVDRGIDMFDCVFPTRNARNATVFTKKGRVQLKNNAHDKDYSPIEEDCPCFTCRNYSRSYLRHMFKLNEIVVHRLSTIHNLVYWNRLMQDIRRALQSNRYPEFKKEFYQYYQKQEGIHEEMEI